MSDRRLEGRRVEITDPVTITVNGREVTAQKGELVIDACERNDAYIPRFCYHPRMEPVGMCRMCLVEIDTGRGPALQPLVDKLQEQLGRDTEVRLGMRMDQPVVWIRLNVGPEGNTRGVWAGFPIRNVDSGEVPTRLWITLGAVLLLLLAGTYWFARRLAKPLAELADAVDKVAEGKRPDPLPVDGPEEISRVARNVNRMAANLEQLERDRSTMLAGISHDIRTPLTRLRLASEISVNDAQSRDEMAADIDEIDRIVTQFLDFARGTPKEAPEQADLQIVLGAIAHKAASRNLPVTWQPGPEALVVNAYPAAFERMLMNLIENAHRYGKPPVELAVRRDGAMVDIDVLDAGDGVSAGDVERLKQPFVRGDHARGGTMGAEGVRALRSMQFYTNEAKTELGAIITFASAAELLTHVKMISDWEEFRRFASMIKLVDMRVHGRLTPEVEAWIRQFNGPLKKLEHPVVGFVR